MGAVFVASPKARRRRPLEALLTVDRLDPVLAKDGMVFSEASLLSLWRTPYDSVVFSVRLKLVKKEGWLCKVNPNGMPQPVFSSEFVLS